MIKGGEHRVESHSVSLAFRNYLASPLEDMRLVNGSTNIARPPCEFEIRITFAAGEVYAIGRCVARVHNGLGGVASSVGCCPPVGYDARPNITFETRAVTPHALREHCGDVLPK